MVLEHDHVPSFAALRTAKEAVLGRPLTELETKILYQNSTAVEVPRDVHIAGPTYGFVEKIVSNPEIERRQSVDGTTYYLDNSTKTIVIRGREVRLLLSGRTKVVLVGITILNLRCRRNE